jgi:hypothetical protein
VVTHVHVHGVCKQLLVEGCECVVILVDAVSDKLVVSGSEQVRIAMAGALCPHVLWRNAPRTIVHCVHELASAWIDAIGSDYSGFILARNAQLAHPSTPEAIITCSECSQVLVNGSVPTSS